MSKLSIRAREIADLRDQIRLKKSTVTNLRGAHSSIEKERAQLTASIKKLQEDAQKEMRVIGQQGQALKQQLEELNVKRNEVKKRFHLLKEEYEQKSKTDPAEAVPVKESAREVYNELAGYEQERKKIKNRLTNLHARFQEIKETADEKLKEHHKSVDEYSSKLADYKRKVKSLERDIKQLEKQILEKQGRSGDDADNDALPIRVDADGNIIDDDIEDEEVDPQKVIHETKYGKPEKKEKPPKAPGPIIKEKPSGAAIYKFASDALLAVLRMNIVNGVRTSRTIIREATDEEENSDLSLTGWEDFNVGRFIAESYIYFRIAIDAIVLIYRKSAEDEAFKYGLGDVPNQSELYKEWFHDAIKLLDNLGVAVKKLGIVIPTKIDIRHNTEELLTGKRTALLPRGFDLEQTVPENAPIVKQLSANPNSPRNKLVDHCFKLIHKLYDFFAHNSAVLIDSFGTLAHGDDTDDIALAKETQRITSQVNGLAEEGKILLEEIRKYEMIDPKYKSIVHRFRKQEKVRNSLEDDLGKGKRVKGGVMAAVFSFIILAGTATVLFLKEILTGTTFIFSVLLVIMIPFVIFLVFYNMKGGEKIGTDDIIPPQELKHLEAALLKLGESGNRLKAIVNEIHEHLKGLPNLQDIRLR